VGSLIWWARKNPGLFFLCGVCRGNFRSKILRIGAWEDVKPLNMGRGKYGKSTFDNHHRTSKIGDVS